MISNGTILKKAMSTRGFKHRRTEDQFTINGEYARNLQHVFSKEYQSRDGLVVDLVYFSVDVIGEKLVIGLYRENSSIENGVYINRSSSIPLQKYNIESVNNVLNKLIVPVNTKF